MRTLPTSGNAASHRIGIGEFEHKNKDAKFKQYQAAPRQVAGIAARHPHSTPQRLTLATALYAMTALQSLSLNPVRGVRGASASQSGRQMSALYPGESQRRLPDSISSAHSVVHPDRDVAFKPSPRATTMFSSSSDGHQKRVPRESVSLSTTSASFQKQDQVRSPASMPSVFAMAREEHRSRRFAQGGGKRELVLQHSDRCAYWWPKSEEGKSERPLSQTGIDQDDAIARLQDSNEQVARLLFGANSEVSRNWRSETSRLIEQAIIFSEEGPQSRAILAQNLLHSKGMYGAEAGEQVSVALQKKVIRDWICQNILGTSIAQYIQKTLVESVQSDSSLLNTRQLYDLLTTTIVDSKVRSLQERNWLINDFIFEELPALQYLADNRERNDPDFRHFWYMRIDDFEWGEVHAGLLFAKHVGLTITQVAIAEAAELGRAIMLQLDQGGAPQAWWTLFMLPAFIQLAQRCPQEVASLSGHDRIVSGFRVLDYYAKEYQRFLYRHCPILQFAREQQNFKTRSVLAEEIIKKRCPGMAVETYLNGRIPLCPDDHPYLSEILPSALASFYPAELKHLPDINQAFQAEVDKLAVIYESLDKLSMVALWSELDTAEIEFQSAAQIKIATPKFVASVTPDLVPTGMSNAVLNVQVNLDSTVDFFHVSQWEGEERIYALYKENTKYRLLRVDRQASHYYRFLGDDKRPAVNQHFSLIVDVDSSVLKPSDQALTTVFEHFAKEHRKVFAKALYDFGYEKTQREKVFDTLDSLLPFFICGKSISEEKVGEAMLFCSLDTISLIPAFWSIGELSNEIAGKLISGSMVTMTYAARRTAARVVLEEARKEAGSDFIRYGFLPALDTLTEERMQTLGMSILRGLDPGVELLGAIGQGTFRQALHICDAIKHNLPRLRDLLPRLRRTLRDLPEEAFPDLYEYARLPGLEMDVAVTRLAGKSYGGRPVYVRIHHETGQRFGRMYSLSEDGKLDLIEMPVGKRLHFIREQGLGGLGSKEQGSRWAQRISATLLLQAQDALKYHRGSLAEFAEQYHINRLALADCIGADGILTVQGQEIVDAATAGSSRMADAASVQLIRHIPSIKPDETVIAALRCQDGEVLSNLEDRYKYNVDGNVFVAVDPIDTSYAYTIKPGSTQLAGVTLGQARDIERLSSLDQRSAVLRALDIDLNLAVLTKLRWQPAANRLKIPKLIHYVWVGNKPLSQAILIKIEKCVLKAMEKDYSVVFYLSEEARDANFHPLNEIMSAVQVPSTGCLTLKKNRLLILEETEFYEKFRFSKIFDQYRNAIDGNGGIATNYASAADILRFALIKEHGGLYLDVDDELTEQFDIGTLEVEPNHFALSGLMRSETLDMYHEFGTGFFGTHANNPVIDDILNEMAIRYQEPEYQNFYQTRPSRSDQRAMLAYQSRLFYLTGPGVFNTVLRATFPELKAAMELEKLKDIANAPETSEIIKEITENLPGHNDISPLRIGYKPGSMHSWMTYRA